MFLWNANLQLFPSQEGSVGGICGSKHCWLLLRVEWIQKRGSRGATFAYQTCVCVCRQKENEWCTKSNTDNNFLIVDGEQVEASGRLRKLQQVAGRTETAGVDGQNEVTGVSQVSTDVEHVEVA